MTTDTRLLTASTLAFPFADRLVPADRALTAGTTLPCSQQKVQTKPLAATLVALALWDLRGRGVIGFEPFTKKVLFRTTQHTGIRRVGGPLGVPGIEDGLLDALKGDLEENAVRAVVFRWLGRDSRDPHGRVVATVEGNLAQLGLYEEVDAQRGRVSGALMGKTKLSPRCDRLAALAGSFDQLATAWKAFAVSEAALHAALLKEAGDGIESRRETSD